ncbi:response regulator transcription factor [Glycomyces sp. TRM65418]|uniref:helix-turn-helix transcriptional regulator n=1 Tax=Glycomyces sp. TRM65418 TaxID=2867006 RepID=UPI001CE61621|nr:response regulator transcription factor [Glycomyces sp. TRM65418]MCC3763169.1 response regulator transcription factor [Glycomyces sp. TRM65418]QZD57173.1 response regulator transcription factor [Glycomyces sp. TRM65418]
MIRVLVHHEQCLWRTALRRGLAGEQGIDLVDDVNQDDDVVTTALRVRPDVLIHDSGLLPPARAAEICGALPGMSVLLLVDPSRAAGLPPDLTLMAPRVGFINTGETFDRLIEAIHRLTGGEPVIDGSIALAAIRAQANPLTKREQEVLSLILTGATTREIAEKMFLQVGTVRNYLSNAIHKSGARSRIDAVRIAQEAGWI